MVLSSKPDDFRYDDSTGVFFHKSDISLRIVFDRGDESDDEFHEPWVTNFPDPRGTRQPVYIYYGQTRVMEVPCVYVDGGRHVIPFPRSRHRPDAYAVRIPRRMHPEPLHPRTRLRLCAQKRGHHSTRVSSRPRDRSTPESRHPYRVLNLAPSLLQELSHGRLSDGRVYGFSP